MRQIFYILLLVLGIGFFGGNNAVEGNLCVDVDSVVSQCLISEQSSSDGDATVIHKDEMLRVLIARYTVLEPQTTTSAPSRSARFRNLVNHKIMASAISDRRAGHVTRIFEFNHFRSSLRVAYYLYALCRLRI